MGEGPRRIVADGYDRIADRYLEWIGRQPSAARLEALEWLLGELHDGSDLLELGCGAGIPMTARMAERHHVTGIDISPRQIALARHNVPAARFEVGDMTAVSFADRSFDAIVSFYALTHVPRGEHGPLLGRVARWLRPGGLFFATMGVTDDPGVIERDWLGAPMYFSHFDAATNERLVADSGLDVERSVIRAEEEDGVPVAFLWLSARAPVV